MKSYLLIFILLTGISTAVAQENLFPTFQSFKDSLNSIKATPDESERIAAFNALWDTLLTRHRIPFAQDSAVAFLYRGNANKIQFAGDFNQWNPEGGNASFVGLADLWKYEMKLPKSARVDYKIVRDGSSWMLDPANPHLQMSGFGYNSELMMPDYEPSPYLDRMQGVEAGVLTPDQVINSAQLGYSINYRVYTPPGYEAQQNLPVVYVTDGPEYFHPEMGALTSVLDNLIEKDLISPVIAVFIDPSVNGTNLRQEQYLMNEKFSSFVADELVPEIDANYKTNPDRGARAILGTSFGGLNSAWFAVDKPNTFKLIAMQSPALWPSNNAIIQLISSAPTSDLKVFMTWGTMFDGGDTSQILYNILKSKGYPINNKIVHEGHSWGNWSALLDDILIYFWGKETNTSADFPGKTESGLHLIAYPNPFSDSTNLAFSLSEPSQVGLSVYDALGRLIVPLIRGYYTEGPHQVYWEAADLPVGVYYCRLESIDFGSEVRVVTKVR